MGRTPIRLQLQFLLWTVALENHKPESFDKFDIRSIHQRTALDLRSRQSKQEFLVR